MNEVKFGTVPAASFSVVDDFTITAVVPVGADTGLISVGTSPSCFTLSIDTFYYDPVACIPPSASAAVTPTTCNGFADGAIDVTVTGGTAPYAYLWNTGATTEDLTGLTAGNYTLIVTGANSCPDTLVVAVTEPGAIVLSALLTVYPVTV